MRELPDPSPAPHGAVIRVEATGLCRSDWHGWKGHDPDIKALPHVPGHELAGVVEAVGPDVRGWRPGARVTVPFICACGTCAACATGDQQVCERQTQPGFTHWGSFAEYVAIDHADVNLVAIPEDMAYVTAAGLGCRFATAFRAVAQVGEVRPGEWVAVHGCGGVGLSAVMIATAAGAGSWPSTSAPTPCTWRSWRAPRTSSTARPATRRPRSES
ncbi:alcohol dehydrogenase catalytic domain-containing protein [Nonomuraea antimicrobica]